MKASIQLHRAFVIDKIDPRIYGGFIEHMGRAVYEGIYEPGHESADEDGFRGDVMALVRELDMPITRYPGGNFVSGYRWEDGIGPKEDRPTRLDLAWKSTEPNQVGVNEFMNWCAKANTEPMMAVNLGTRGAQNAQDMVEYCNFPGGSHFSDLRAEHGVEEPHAIKLWCLGNEMDGPWQMGAKTAREYGTLAREAAKLMRLTDPSIELVVCGSSSWNMPTFGAWEVEVLDECYNQVDYISIHSYFNNRRDDTPFFLAAPDRADEYIKEVAAACDLVQAKNKSSKKVNISYDEWNVWYHSNERDRNMPEWIFPRPLDEDFYNMEDALVNGGFLITLLNNVDRVKIACIAQTVNVIGPIMTEGGGPAWAQTIYYPFQHASRFGRGTALRQVVETPRYDTEIRKDIPYLTSAAVLSVDEKELTIFAVNRNLDETLDLEVACSDLAIHDVTEWIIMDHADLKAVNTAEEPEKIVPRSGEGVGIHDGRVSAALPPASWNVIRLAL